MGVCCITPAFVVQGPPLGGLPHDVSWPLSLRILLGTDHLRTITNLIVIYYDGGNRWADATGGAFTPKYGNDRYVNIKFSQKLVYYITV